MLLRIAFTGTQQGMSERQKTTFAAFLKLHINRIEAFHHGDCIGADADAHEIAESILGVDKIWIHPPENPKKRAYCKSPHILPELPYLERNHEMVDIAGAVIAAPKSMREEWRSGTWATIRYAKKLKRPLKILEP